MWFVFSVICLACWGFADLFYKKSSDDNDKYSHLRIAVWVGLVMGISALIILPFAEHGSGVLTFDNIKKYLPASLSYIVSMVIGYAGMRYLEISIISPVQNASGAMAAVFMTLYFLMAKGNAAENIKDEIGFSLYPSGATELINNLLIIFGIVAICLGVIMLAVVEKKLSHDENGSKKYRFGAMALLFPLSYCYFDTLGTVFDGIILDEETGLGLGEKDVLVLYGITFALAGIVCWFYLLFKEKKAYNPLKDIKTAGTAALFEEAGQVFYVYAMSDKPVLAAPIIASYCIFSVVLSRLILKEKLKKNQYACVFAVIAGIVMLGISESVGA